MKTYFFSVATCRHLWAAASAGLILTSGLRALAQNESAPPPRPVSSSDSTLVKGARVYSIKFSGGTAGEFFDFLHTNGFSGDNVLFAGKAASVPIPPFAVKRVRLRDVAKSLELVSEGKLAVEIVEQGEQSDENIWRIRASEGGSPIRTKTCPMANFFHTPNAAERIPQIVRAVERVLAAQLDMSGRPGERGSADTLETEKIVIVVGPEAYVEAVSSALEAAEKVATADMQRQK